MKVLIDNAATIDLDAPVLPGLNGVTGRRLASSRPVANCLL